MFGQGRPANRHQTDRGLRSRFSETKRVGGPSRFLDALLFPLMVLFFSGPSFRGIDSHLVLRAETRPVTSSTPSPNAGKRSETIPLRLNLTWNSAEPVLWEGEIRVDQGFFWNSLPLGTDPSASASISRLQENEGILSIRPLSSVSFGGIQTTIASPREVALSVSLRSQDGSVAVTRSFSRQDLENGPIQVPFDSDGHGLSIQRAPGDLIPLTVSRMDLETKTRKDADSSMVFREGETLLLGVFMKFLPEGTGGARTLHVAVQGTGKDEILWSDAVELTDRLIAERPRLDIPVPLRNLEGAFDVTLEVSEKRTDAKNSANPKGMFPIPQNPFAGSGKDSVKETLLARRVVQGVVIAPRPQNDEVHNVDSSDLRETLLETIDPTNPSWWKIFARRAPFLDKGVGDSSPSKVEESERPEKSAQRDEGNESDRKKKGPLPFLGQMESPEGEDGTSLPLFEGGRILGQSGTTTDPKDENNPFWSGSTEFLNMWKWGELQSTLSPFKWTANWGQWDNLWQHPLGSGNLTPLDSKDPRDSAFVSLAPGADPDSPSWESYTVPIKEPGKPHLLEIEYLSDHPQKLGVTILEPSLSGGIFPRSLDNGLIVREDPLSDQIPHRILRYQVLFWPKTKTPMILLMNRDSESPAIYGRIRIYRAKDALPSISTPKAGRGGRSFAAVMTRPTFCEEFHAENAPSFAGVLGAQDWRTFYQGGKRLVDYLKSSGYDSLLLSVMADGSALYPSELIHPNPKFDSGLFLTEGNDPVRKDVAGFLFQLFEEEGMTFHPLLTFNAPLPELEEVIAGLEHEKDRASDPFYSIGPKGERLTVKTGENAEYSPYNLLHPRVRREILRVVDEFATRYAGYSSFRGLTIDLQSGSFATLPENIYFGLDDETVRRFVQETRLAERIPAEEREKLRDFVLATDEDRYYRRAVLIRDSLRKEWIQWRAETVARFYAEMVEVIANRRPDIPVYLTEASLIPSPERIVPFPTDSFDERNEEWRLLQRGINPDLLKQVKNLVVIRSTDGGGELSRKKGQISSFRENAGKVVFWSRDGVADGALFYHHADPVNLASFDRVSPFQPTLTQIATRCALSDYQNRERLAHQLAICDTLTFMDGGEMIPMGREEALREWIVAFRSLPPVPFETYSPKKGEKEDGGSEPQGNFDPVVFRYLRTADGFWGYLVNDAPFHSGVTLSMKHFPNAQTEIFAGGREIGEPVAKNDGFRWSCSLKPYDLVAFRIADPGATPESVEVTLPKEICGSGGRLERNLTDYLDRLRLTTNGVEIPLRNSGFEEFPDAVEEPVFSGGKVTGDDLVEEETRDSKSLLSLDIPKMNLLRNPFSSDDRKGMTDGGITGEGDGGTDNDVSPVENRFSGMVEIDSFPGWRRFGKGTRVFIDRDSFQEGNGSLRMTNSGGMGGILSQPFATPETGRLYVGVTFGVPESLPEIPLKISLSGYYQGEPWQRQLSVGPTLMKRTREAVAEGSLRADHGVIWRKDSVVFDDLPIRGLTDLSIRFDLVGDGELWVDDVHLYQLALGRAEQVAMIETVQNLQADWEAGRIRSILDALSTPFADFLASEFPDDSPLMANRPERSGLSHPEPTEEGTGSEEVAESGREITESDNEGENPKEAKNFFRRILPW